MVKDTVAAGARARTNSSATKKTAKRKCSRPWRSSVAAPTAFARRRHLEASATDLETTHVLQEPRVLVPGLHRKQELFCGLWRGLIAGLQGCRVGLQGGLRQDLDLDLDSDDEELDLGDHLTITVCGPTISI